MFPSWRASNVSKLLVHKEGQKESTRGTQIQANVSSLSCETEPVFVLRALRFTESSVKNCLWSQGWRRVGPSHAAIFLSGLVRHRGVRGVKGRSQCAEKTSQQREAQSAPRAEHGPAVAVTDVLWYSKHVAGIAGQFKVDPGHACAEGNYTARP